MAGRAAQAEPAAAPVGYVEDFAGRSEAYEGRRGDAVLAAIGFYLPLRQGDRIIVLRPGGRVVLRLGAAAQRVEITQADSPYTVTVTEAPRSVLGTLAAQFGELITSRHDLMVHAGAAMAGGTPLELRLPGLADGRAQVAAGRRALGLPWSGVASVVSAVGSAARSQWSWPRNGSRGMASPSTTGSSGKSGRLALRSNAW